MKPSSARGLTLLAAALFAPAASHACDCPGGLAKNYLRDATDVPTNVQPAVQLTSWSGEIVGSLRPASAPTSAATPLEVAELYGAGISRFVRFQTPSDLEPHTAYVFEFGNYSSATFTTGPGPDHTSPEAPRHTYSAVAHEPSVHLCGTWYGGDCPGKTTVLVHDPDATADTGADPDATSYLEARLTAETQEWSGFFGQGYVFVGSAHCEENLPEIDTLSDVTVQLRRWDFAGNTSPWSAPTSFTLPTYDMSLLDACDPDPKPAACGCQQTSAPPLSGILPLLLLGHRRRRRSA